MSIDWAELHDCWQAGLGAELDDAVALRRQIHAAPDGSHREGRTAQLVAAELGAAESPPVAGTGRLVRAGQPSGPSVAIRAELDGLPIVEETGVAWASTNGFMHACGHDVHLAALVAVMSAARQVGLPAGLLAVLQPSEETFPSGAREIVRTGALGEHDVRAMLAVHLQPRLPDGEVAVTPGAVNASSDEFELEVVGVGGHAGYPHLTRDPVVALCSVVVGLQHVVARNIDPTRAAVITVGSLAAGAAANVVPDAARARGSVRALDPADRHFLQQRITDVSEQIAAAHGCRATVRIVEGEPALVNDPQLATAAGPWLTRFGLRLGEPFQSCGADDFAFYGEVSPSLMVFVGTGNAAVSSPGLHHPRFLPPDSAVATVARTMVASAVSAFSALELPGRIQPRSLASVALTTPQGDSGFTTDAPLLRAYTDALTGGAAPFTIPGHKRRADQLDAGLAGVVAPDVLLYGGLDTVGLRAGVLAEAEGRAARLWGVDWCRFTTGGSTSGNQALALALGQPGDRVLVTRSLHRSLLLGLVLAGLKPIWLSPQLDPVTGVPTGIRVEDVDTALQAAPDAVAVLLVEPGYLGTLSDIVGVADVAHARGVPLVVDAAWGAHLGFAPELPLHPLAMGADAIVTSAHKTLPAYSQGALVLARTDRLDPARLDAGVDATHTTSPAGAILASIDGARALLEASGPQLFGQLVPLVTHARERLNRAVPGLVVLGPDQFPPGRFDPTKLVLQLPGTGADGVAVESELITAGTPVEMADRDTIVPIVTIADDASTIDRLLNILIPALLAASGPPRPTVTAAWRRHLPEQVLPPRTAFFAQDETVPAAEAAGRVSAELIAPYPPGIPALAPGERITGALLADLQATAAAGTRVAYAADPSLATIRVVRDAADQKEDST